MSAAPVFFLTTTGRRDAVEWTTVCHRHDPFYTVSREDFEPFSRWESRECVRRFVLTWHVSGRSGRYAYRIGRYSTAERAAERAERHAREVKP